jgi:hypothetical protein
MNGMVLLNGLEEFLDLFCDFEVGIFFLIATAFDLAGFFAFIVIDIGSFDGLCLII